MLAQIRNSRCFRATNLALFCGAVLSLGACATKEEPQLVSGSQRESSLPWNRQEKWEQNGSLTGIAEHLETR